MARRHGPVRTNRPGQMAHQFWLNRVFCWASYGTAEPWPPDLALDLDRTPGRSLTQQIAGPVGDIQRGRLRPGDRLPGHERLRLLKVHRQTVVTAIDDLVAEGWLVCKKASGTFVADGLPRHRPSPARHRAISSSLAAAIRLGVGERRSPSSRERGRGRRAPHVRHAPGCSLVARGTDRSLLSPPRSARSTPVAFHNHPAGLARLRQQLALMLSLARGLAIDAASIMVTRGSQMALTLLAHALIRPGDAVAVEHPGYRPAEAFGLPAPRSCPCTSTIVAWTSARCVN